MPWFVAVTGGFALGSNEANNNAVMIHNQLISYGYTYNAMCAILGNIGFEGVYNPWRWQSDIVLASTDTYEIEHQSAHAYGLFQFDPAGQYVNNQIAQGLDDFGVNFSDISGNRNDGTAQIYYMNFLSNGYIPTTAYPITFAEFKASTSPVDYLTKAWEYNYERGTWSDVRLEHASYWEEHLHNIVPPITNYRKMKWIYYLKRRIH